MKSLRLNIRALTFDGKAPLPSTARIVHNSHTASHDVIGQGGSSFAKFGALSMRDLATRGVVAAADHVYVSWVGHSGGAGVTSFVVRSQQSTHGRRVGTSPARETNPSAGTGPVGPFALRPNDELVLTSNRKGEQVVTLALLTGTAAEVGELVNRG